MSKTVISRKLLVSLFSFIVIGFIELSALSVLLPINPDATFQSLQTSVTAHINNIIREELSVILKKKHANYHFPSFRVQTLPHITLLFDRTVHEKFDLPSVLALQVMQSLGKGCSLSGNVELTGDADLFGFHNEFVVLKVHDDAKAILNLRNDITTNLKWLNHYACASDIEEAGLLNPFYRFGSWIKSFFVPVKTPRSLFDMKRWDTYPFTPHVTLGTLPRQEIFKIASWHKADAQQVWETIKNRVRLEVFLIIKKAQVEQKLACTSFSLHSKNYTKLHEFSCEHVVDTKNMTPVIDTV